MDPIENLNRIFNQETDIEYDGASHAALTGLVAGYLSRMKAEMPIVLGVGHADAAGIPVIMNDGQYPKGRRFIVIVAPVD